MKVYRLHREQILAASMEQVFDFFSRAENLEVLTPPWLGFRILTPLPIEMAEGTRIEYRIRLGPAPVRWVTRIAAWEPPHGFVDVQERGPYRLWEHTHRFAPHPEGVRMTDEVRYALPFGPLGRLTHFAAVRGALRRIFDYRFARISEQFGSHPSTGVRRTELSWGS